MADIKVKVRKQQPVRIRSTAPKEIKARVKKLVNSAIVNEDIDCGEF